MKKYFILFLLPFILFGCKKEDIFINEFTFYIDGVFYDITCIPKKNIGTNEFGVEGFRYSPSSPVDSLFYYFMGYNANTCGDCDCAYGGQFLDRSAQKQTMFYFPNDNSTSFKSYFWIRLDKGRTYDAISGYIEMINIDVQAEHDKTTLNRNNYKAHGTFEFVMVNRENELDTIRVKNGKFNYQCYVYTESYQTLD